MSRLREELQVIPRAAMLTAVLVAGTIAALIITLADEAPSVRLAIACVVVLIVSLYVLLVGYVYADAKRRGMRHVIWTLVVIFVPNAIGFIAYFLLREPVLTPCGRCGTPARREFAYCPHCGATLRRACPECHKPVEPFWSHCAHCGISLTTEAGESSVANEACAEPSSPDAT